MRSLSLRYKLLVLLVTLPLVSLGAYLALATHLFESDKIAYVFDTNALAARAIASQAKYEINNNSDKLQQYIHVLLESKSGITPKFRTRGSDRANDDAMKISAIELLESEPQGKWKVLAERHSPAAQSSDEQSAAPRKFPDARNLKLERELRIDPAGKDFPDWLLWSGEFRARSKSYGYAAWIRSPVLSRLFSKTSTFTPYLLSHDGRIALAPENQGFAPNPEQGFSEWNWYKSISRSKIQQGSSQTQSPSGEPLLGSYSAVDAGSLLVVTLVRRSDALQAVRVLLVKSLLFFVALLSLSLIASVFASRSLTRAIRVLYEATKRVATGDFNIHVDIQSRDEIASLGDSFNKMAAEVSRLLSETADKARMEKELETARTVQETLFPDPVFAAEGVKLKGYYMPASECGGDWWYHTRIGDKLFVWVGDATGHGAPAALITSAARSAASVVESLPDVTPTEAMRLLNRAIRKTSKGTIMMTFFIAAIDLKTGVLTYANASHDPPFLLRRPENGRALTKADVEPMNDVNSPRLGEEDDFEYSEARVQLNPGDSIVFYTDGVSDVPNSEGTALGTKKFVTSVLKAISTQPEIDRAADAFWKDLLDYRGQSVLPDDVTVVCFRYDGVT